jgi:DNA-binding IclR family transcriptional regulator
MGEPMDWPLRAAEFLRQMRDRTGETSNLGALTESEIVYLAQQRALDALIVSNPIGTRRPWHCSALGKAILAYLPEPELGNRLAGKPLTRHTYRTITDSQTFLIHLATIREQGYAIDDEETFVGVRCVAAPVFDHSNQVIASMGISGPSIRLTEERLPEFAAIVVDVASQASAFFGAPKPATTHLKTVAHAVTET